jgi:RHS repeat-associated protein
MDQHLASTDPNGSTLYRLADAQNSTVATVDQLGSVQSRFFYEPYGHTTALGPPAIFEYIGRIPITDTLYDFRARTYDTETSRFLREDPIQFAGGDSNFYAYARDNPINLTDPTGLAPNKQFCQRLLEKIENVQNSIDKRIGELDEDPLGLPETCSGDDTAPSLSRQGHRRLINEDKALLAALKGTYLALCSDDPPNGTPAPNESFFDRKYWEKITGLTGAALIAYLIISEGSRLFPPRNLVPVP